MDVELNKNDDAIEDLIDPHSVFNNRLDQKLRDADNGLLVHTTFESPPMKKGKENKDAVVKTDFFRNS